MKFSRQNIVGTTTNRNIGEITPLCDESAVLTVIWTERRTSQLISQYVYIESFYMPNRQRPCVQKEDI